MSGSGNRDAGEESVWGDEAEGSGEGDGEGDGEGEMVLEEVKDEGDDGWGKAEWGAEGENSNDAWGAADDRYKAPHVRALEQRAAMAANGW